LFLEGAVAWKGWIMGRIDLDVLRRQAMERRLAPGALLRTELRRREARQARAAPPDGGLVRRGDKLVDPVELDVAARWVVAYAMQPRETAADLCALGFRAYCPLGRRTLYRARGLSGKRERKILQFPVGEASQPLTRSAHARIVQILGNADGSIAVSPAAVAAINAAELAGNGTRPRNIPKPRRSGRA